MMEGVTMKRTHLWAVIALSACVGLAGFASAEETADAKQRCLAASESGDHASAVAACSLALESEPEDESVRKALEVAKASLGATDVASPPAAPAPAED